MSVNIQKNINLAQFSTFKIGGNAKFYTEIKNKDDLMLALYFAKKNNEKIYFLGGGSNVLIDSKGINGVLMRFCNDSIDFHSQGLICGAGTTLLNALIIAMKNGFSGLEWSYGIPRATIGGSVYGNSGAFQVLMSDIVENVEVFDIKKGQFIIFDNKSCKFSYKNSIFKENKNYLIWKVTLSLKKEKLEIIKKTCDDYLTTRLKTQSKHFSIGCIFKNISIVRVKKENPDLIDKFKIKSDFLSTGFLIDSLGLKGKTIGDAKISEKHANFIINIDEATSFDIISLIKYIKEKVKNEYNISLEEEIALFNY